MEPAPQRWIQASALALPICLLLSGSAPPAPVGEKLPKGPPWHTEYRTAKRAALRQGKPVYVYFTKSY